MISDFEPSGDFRVNPVQDHEQEQPRTVLLEDGRFLVVWRIGWVSSYAGRIFERDGTPATGEFRISDWHHNPLAQMGVTPLPGGGFAVTWAGRSTSESNKTDLILQIFDPAGERQGDALVIDYGTSNSRYNPAVALLASGNLVLTWDHITTTGTQITNIDVKAQIFTPSGARVGSEFIVNTTTLDYQQPSTVTALAEGGFVVAWHDSSRTNPYGDSGFTAAQVFTDTGARVGGEFRVNTVSHNDQRGATIAALSNGGFVVVWTDTSTGSTFEGGFPAKFQLFTAAGAKIGGEVTIDTSGTSGSDSARVTKLAGGGFIVSWVDEVWSGGYILSSQVFGQVYDEDGGPVGGRLTLSAETPYHWDPSIVSLADGSFVVSYGKNDLQGVDRDVYARLFTAVRSGETLHGTGAGETLGGGDLDDFLGGYGGNDVLAGGAGEDLLDGGTGDDQIDGGADADRLAGSAGNDRLDGGTGADIVDGGAGDDQLDGGADSDRLRGGAGNDWLDGSAGADRMAGGSGDDVYIVDDPGDVVVEVAGQGSDEVRTALASYVIPVGVERLTGMSAEGQTLTGGSAADTITGGGGDDALNGAGGNDVLDGGAGADTMTGGTGNDTYLIDSADSIVEAADGGTDEIRTAAASYTLAIANVENLRGLSDAGQALAGDEGNNRIEGAAGADLLDGAGGADTLFGGAGVDSLVGGGGNDVLIGGADSDSLAGGEANDNLDGSAGSDSLSGGEGDDVLKFSAAAGSGDVDSLDGGGGLDVLVAFFGAAADPAGLRHWIRQDTDGSYSGWYAQGSERVEFSGIEAFHITGSVSADQLLGGALADYLFGGAGNDLIEGGRGNDLIVGEDGSDMLVGGAGDDRYVVSDGSDTIVEEENGGTDKVDASIATYMLGANIENLTGTGTGAQTLTGNDLANRIVALGGSSLLQGAGGPDILEGGSWNDTLDGGAGADTMRGGNGDDIYIVDDANDLVVDSDGWSDEIHTALAQYTLTAASGVENLNGLATTGQTLIGTATRNSLRGGSGDDRLLGMGGSDILLGGDGADYLDTGIYAGHMLGGAGDDTYVVDYSGEYILEFAGGGIDRVLTNLSSYTLVDHVELLTGTVDTGQDLRGNAANNVVTGGGGNDVIRLQDAGTDSAFGNGGDDFIFFGGGLVAADRADGGDGSDLLTLQGAGINVTFAAATVVNVETLSVLSHKDARFGLGSATPFHYRLVSADATVAAGALLTVDGSGLASVESLTFDGGAETDGRFVLRGGAGNDSLRGGAGADRIEGGAGNDTLEGGAGLDELIGGGGNDIFYFGTALSAGDVADGGDGRDAIVLQGNVVAVLTETNLVEIESISIQSGANTFFGDTANNLYDYDVTTADGNVAAGQQMIVNAQSLRVGEDLTFDGSAETDGRFLIYGGHGVDLLTGGAGADVFFFEGQRWGPDDKVVGGAGRDSMVISAGSGLNRIEFVSDSITGIESISLNNLYASDPSQKPSYELVLHNGNVAPGGTLIVNGNSIPFGQVVNIDGSAVQDGNLILFAGGGHDVLTGGAGADLLFGGGGADALTGGAGADTFRYDSVSDSSGGLHDLIGDFQTGLDRIDLSRIDANTFAAGNQAFSWIGSSAFSGAGAASAGELRLYEQGGYQRIEGDTNGDGIADLLIVLQVGTAPLAQGDFLL